jgi:hypothetical protein
MKSRSMTKYIAFSILCGVSLCLCLSAVEWADCRHVQPDEFLDFFGDIGGDQIEADAPDSFLLSEATTVSSFSTSLIYPIPFRRLTAPFQSLLSEIIHSTVLQF